MRQFLFFIGCLVAGIAGMSSAYANCSIISPVRTSLAQPVALSPGIIDLQFDCKLAESKILSFPLDAISKADIFTSSLTSITPVSSARAAYLLPAGNYQFTLTANIEHSTKVTFLLRTLVAFQQENSLHVLMISAFGGFCIALCIYVGILGRSLRNAGFYAYSGYILCAGIYFVLQEGLLKILFPDAYWVTSHELKSVFAGATVFTALRFISLLLDLRLILKPWEHNLLRYIGLAVLGLGLISLIPFPALHNTANYLMGYITLLGIVTIIAATSYAVIRKVHGAGLVLLALLVLLMSMTIRVALPEVSPFIQRYGLIIAVTIEALLLAIAASERVKRLQKDKMEAYLAASSDPLCPVLNRRGWEDAARKMLAAHAKKGGIVVLMFIDLNDFKQVNDTYGHKVGDDALIILAKILNSQSRAQDIVGRMGGDEFVLMGHCQNRGIADRIIQRISDRLKDLTLRIDDQHIALSASVGAQLVDAPHNDLSMLLHQADMLMYEQKAAQAARAC